MCYVIGGSFSDVSTRNMHCLLRAFTEHCFGFVIYFLLLTDVLKALGHDRIALYCALSTVLLCPNPVHCTKML